MRPIIATMLLFATASVRGAVPLTNANAGAQTSLLIEANASRYRVGEPIVLKFTLTNAGTDAFHLEGMRGWGSDLWIFTSGDAATQPVVRPDVTHGDGDWVSYYPRFYYTGSIQPGSNQSIIHFVSTENMRPGRLRLMANMRSFAPPIESGEIEVTLESPPTSEDSQAAASRKTLAVRVTRMHNRLGRVSRFPEVVPLTRKALSSNENKLETEYCHYVGILQGIARDATDEDRTLAKEAAKAFLERFPKSWLRAHVYAALVMIHQKEGDTEAAAQALKAGQALPESRPLFQNLGLVPEAK